VAALLIEKGADIEAKSNLMLGFISWFIEKWPDTAPLGSNKQSLRCREAPRREGRQSEREDQFFALHYYVFFIETGACWYSSRTKRRRGTPSGVRRVE
jgi:hypothetical protein